MAIGGALLRIISTGLYAIEFCCAAIIVGFYGYFMSVEADRNEGISRDQQATIGMAGAICLYTIFAVVLTCCLGGKTFFAFLAIVLDVLCCGGFVAIAILTRNGANSCHGYVHTPIGDGQSNSKEGFNNGNNDRKITYAVSLGTACRYNSACFAVAIIGAILFLFSIIMQIFLGRHHKKEKRYGPSPSNGYTKGSGVKFWQRRRNRGIVDPES